MFARLDPTPKARPLTKVQNLIIEYDCFKMLSAERDKHPFIDEAVNYQISR